MPRKGKASKSGSAAGAAPGTDASEVESLMFAAKETLTHAAQSGLLQDKLTAVSQQAPAPAATLVVNDVNHSAPAARGKHYVVAKDSYPSKLPPKLRDEIVSAVESDVLELLMTQQNLGYGRRHSAREDTVNEGVFQLEWVQGVRFVTEDGKQKPVQADINSPDYGFQQPKGTDTASKLRVKLYRKKLDDAAKFWSQVEQAKADAEREAAAAKVVAALESVGSSGKGRKLRGQQKQKREQQRPLLLPAVLRGGPAAAEDEAAQRTWDSHWEKQAAHLEAMLSGLSSSGAPGEPGSPQGRVRAPLRKEAAEKFARTLLQAKRSGELHAMAEEWERAHPKTASDGSKKGGGLKGKVEQHLVGAERQMDSIVRNLKTVREAVDKLKDYAMHSPSWLAPSSSGAADAAAKHSMEDALPEDGVVLASEVNSDEDELEDVHELKAVKALVHNIFAEALQKGTLEAALLAASGVEAKDAEKQGRKAMGARDLAAFKAMATQTLHQAAENGTLEAAVTEVMEQEERKKRAAAEASDQDGLRRQIWTALLGASESGALAKVLKRKKKEATLHASRESIRKLLLQALRSGSLEAAVTEAAGLKDQSGAPEVASKYTLSSATRKTWMRVLEDGALWQATMEAQDERCPCPQPKESVAETQAVDRKKVVKEKLRAESGQSVGSVKDKGAAEVKPSVVDASSVSERRAQLGGVEKQAELERQEAEAQRLEDELARLKATVQDKVRREQEQSLRTPPDTFEAEDMRMQLRAVLEVAEQNGGLQDAISSMLRQSALKDQETQVKLVAVREDLQELRRHLVQARLVEDPGSNSRDNNTSAAPSHPQPATEAGICGSAC